MSEVIKKEIKDEILFKIKSEGMRVSDAAEKYGFCSRTIYGWLSSAGITNSSSRIVAQQKREIDGLYAIIGKLSTELNRLKKGRSWK
jgi:transposase-like protein